MSVDSACAVAAQAPDTPWCHSSARADHNRLTRALHDALGPHVREVIDHHEGECPYAAARQDIVQVGSCSTLVVRAHVFLGS